MSRKEQLTQPDDSQLIRDYINGDFAAFESLYARHKGGSFRFILRQVKDVSSAEDLMQELWCKVVSNIRQFKLEARFTTWLYQMARNLLVDRFRHLAVVSEVIVNNSEHQEVSDVGDASQELQQTRQKMALQHCMKLLPKAQLESFLLKEEANLTQADVAQVTGVSLEAAKSRLRAAYRGLRHCLGLKLGDNDEQ